MSIGVVLSIVCVIPYLLDIVKHKTKPRIISWFIWGSIGTVALAAALTDRQYPTALLMFVLVMMDFVVILFGWKNGDKSIKSFEFGCLVAAVIGVVLWLAFDSPATAVIAMITIGLIATVPTLAHAWEKPHEETLVTFVLYAVRSLCTIIALTDWRITASAYPIYLFADNLLIAAIIVYRRREMQAKKTR